MQERIGVGPSVGAVGAVGAVGEGPFARAAPSASAAAPLVLRLREADVAVFVLEPHDAVLRVGEPAVVEGAPRDEGGEFRDRETEQHVAEDVLPTGLLFGDDRGQSLHQPAFRFPQEHAALRARVEPAQTGIRPDFLREQIEQRVRHAGRREDLVARQVRQAVEDVGGSLCSDHLGV